MNKLRYNVSTTAEQLQPWSQHEHAVLPEVTFCQTYTNSDHQEEETASIEKLPSLGKAMGHLLN